MSRKQGAVAFVFACAVVFVLSGPIAAQDRGGKISVATLPPVVVRTMPQSGDTAVDASSVKEIRVTFSKEMADKTWSWSQLSNDTFPKISGEIHYQGNNAPAWRRWLSSRARTYAVWLNSQNFGNFKDKDGHPAVPYLLVFETKPAGG